MTKETIEGCKVIVEFLGWKHHSDNVYWFPNLYPNNKDSTGEITDTIENARFNSEYNWFMPVWHKFRDLKLIN